MQRAQSEALSHLAAGRLDRAASAYARAIRAARRTFGVPSPDEINLRNELVDLESQRQRFDHALAIARRTAVLIDASASSSGGSDVVRFGIRNLIALGGLRRILGETSIDHPELERALALAKDHLPRGDADALVATNNLAVAYKYCGRFDEALILYRDALATLEDDSRVDPLTLATLWHNLGGLHHSRGDLQAAEPASRRSWELALDALGPDHPRTHAESVAYAAVLDGIGRFDEAEARYRQALAFYLECLGERHVETSRVQHNLAALLVLKGRWPEVRRLYLSAATTKKRLLGKSSADLALTRVGLAGALASMGRIAWARRMLVAARDALSRLVTADHPHLRLVDQRIADLPRVELSSRRSRMQDAARLGTESERR
jgi:tetratricopeptide (TPR) repeat protein